MKKRHLWIGLLIFVVIFAAGVGVFAEEANDAEAQGTLSFSVKAGSESFKAGDEVTFTVYLDNYADFANKIGSMSMELPSGGEGYDYTLIGALTPLATDSEISSASAVNMFVYDPADFTTWTESWLAGKSAAEKAALISTLPKTTTALFSFKAKINDGVDTEKGMTIPLQEVIVADDNDVFIAPYDCDSDGTFYDVKCTVKSKQNPGTDFAAGDINGDKKINSVDALQALRHSVGEITLKGEQFIRGDVYKDNKVDAMDALQILRYSVKEITSF